MIPNKKKPRPGAGSCNTRFWTTSSTLWVQKCSFEPRLMVIDPANGEARRVPLNPPREARYMSVDGCFAGNCLVLNTPEYGALLENIPPTLDEFFLNVTSAARPGFSTMQVSMGSGQPDGCRLSALASQSISRKRVKEQRCAAFALTRPMPSSRKEKMNTICESDRLSLG